MSEMVQQLEMDGGGAPKNESMHGIFRKCAHCLLFAIGMRLA
jgi:hypothetical protein